MDDYKVITQLRDFLLYNNGDSGVVVEADTVIQLAMEIQQLLTALGE